MKPFTHYSPGTPAAAWRGPDRPADLRGLSLDGFDRVVVVAAHPDDESLGAGGLLAEAADRALEITLVLATAGERSHPGSPTHTADALAVRRRGEAEAALSILAPEARMVFVDVPDGAVADAEDRLAARIVDVVGEAGEGTLVVAPWRRDGHPDHEAAGRAAAAAARRTDARLAEYPIWWWHWSEPSSAPWLAMRRLPIGAAAQERHARAIAAHTSQVLPLSDAPGDEVLLNADMLAHFSGPDQLYVVEPLTDERLDILHLEDPDPWGVDRRWYEERKRDLVMAMLPRRELGAVLDVGCSTGALTARLAERATRVTALDASPAAVAAARARLARPIAEGSVRVDVAEVPREWPAGRVEVAVLSEVGYFLSPRCLRDLAGRLQDSLDPSGTLVLCHWRHPIDGWPLDGPRVHELFESWWPHPVQGRYIDRDVEVLVLAPEPAWPEPTR
jgi:LmbE family N-acetylglucosaminyl deacetylase/SAM-dependent methyltransferase